MATVLITTIRGSNKSFPGMVSLIATCYFSGDDAPAEVEGYPLEIPVNLPLAYTLADLKNGLLVAVQEKAAILGLTVANQDVDIPSFDSFGA